MLGEVLHVVGVVLPGRGRHVDHVVELVDDDDEFVETWHGWMKAYGTTPVATDLFLDTKRYPDRWLSTDEQVASVRRDIDIAVRLGATVIRAIINTPPEVMEQAAHYAEDNGVRLLLEVHAPFHYAHPWIVRHLEVMDQTGSPALGLMPDMGTYVRRFPRVVTERALRDGARPDLVDLIVCTYDDHDDVHGLMDTVNYMGGGPVEQGLARQATHFTWNDPRKMLDYMPRISQIQPKFYEMTEDYTEYSIPYDEIIPVLIEGGFDGYLSSDYEGNRHIQDAFPVDSVEQVRRQHVMFTRLLGQPA